VESEETRLKRRRKIKEKKTFIKKDEDWRTGLYVLSLDERQPLLSIVERVGSTTTSSRHFVPVVNREMRRNTEAAFLSNQHSYWARVLHLTVFLPDPECLQAQTSLFYMRLTARALPANLMSCFFSFLFHFSLFIRFSFIRIYTRNAMLCNATVERVLAKRDAYVYVW